MRVAFMGSPDFAVPTLLSLVEAGHEIACVFCQPPRPAGRGQRETSCPVHRAASELRLPVRTPKSLRNDHAEHTAFSALDLDVAVVAAYGLILPTVMLRAPRRGCLNVHASLLPRWRGAAPIQAAILAGDLETGVTIMQMDEGLDTGAMLATDSVPIGERDTTADLLQQLGVLGAKLLLRTLEQDPAPVSQPVAGVTYAPKLSRADALLNWREDASSLERRIRAMHPWPGAQFIHRNEAIRVLEAEVVRGDGSPGLVLDATPRITCGLGTALRLRRLQRPGRKPQDAAAFLNGYELPPGTILA